jgi:foldase protein PrsA
MWLNKQKRIAVVTGLALILILSTACGKKEGSAEGGVIATYKGGQVTQQEYDEYVNIRAFLDLVYGEYYRNPEFTEQNVKQLIAQEVIVERVGEDPKKEEEAKENYEKMRDSFSKNLGSEKEVDKRMKENNVTKEQIIRYLTQAGLMDKYFRSQLTNEAVQQQYEENKEQYTIATVSHILIGTENRSKEEALGRAKEVLDKLKQGADFGEMAKEYSEDEGSKERGGTYADADVSGWVPEFKQAALTLPLNKLSEPVETQYGYHIMLVSKRATKPLDEIKQEVEFAVMQKDFTRFIESELPDLIENINLPEPETKEK